MSNGDAEVSFDKTQKVVLSEQIDRISSLPDQLLVHILSFLPTKDAVKTVLIRRFGNLWTSIHNLDFDACFYHFCDDVTYENGPIYEKRLINFIRHVLILHERSDLHTFRLDFEFTLWYTNDHLHLDSPEISRAMEEELALAREIDTWIRFALRKKVKVLDLNFRSCGTAHPEGYHKLPNVVLTSDILTELTLVYCRVEPREHICLRSLKSLSLDGIPLSDKTLIEIISGCPVLESLFIYECCGLHKLNFTSPNLKNVVIHLSPYDGSRLEVSCPYVTSLDISGIELIDLYNVSSGVDAVLGFGSFNCAPREHHEVKMLFEQLCDAEVCTLFTRTIQVFTIWELIQSSCPSMNWRRLVLKTMLSKWNLPGIASLLRHSSDLEVLDIHICAGSESYWELDKRWLMQYEIDGENFWDFQRSSFHCLRRHLKTIRIHGFKIESLAVKLVQFLLRKACVLEKLVIYTNRYCYQYPEPPLKEDLMSGRWMEFSKDILCFPRASPQAVILIL